MQVSTMPNSDGTYQEVRRGLAEACNHAKDLRDSPRSARQSLASVAVDLTVFLNPAGYMYGERLLVWLIKIKML